jgi:hypothetical protein
VKLEVGLANVEPQKHPLSFLGNEIKKQKKGELLTSEPTDNLF